MKRIIAFLILTLCLAVSAFAQTAENSIDMNALQSAGNKWKVIRSETGDKSGHIILQDEIWLMYFLHWRPLTKENRNITPMYVRHQLLNWWGPNMAYFSLSGSEGEITVNGHKAVYVDGNFSTSVKTRFVIWNCEETGRQFVGDINVNKTLETPDLLLETQMLSLHTIKCHGDPDNTGMLAFPSRFVSKEFNISFFKPAQWNTGVFTSSEWYPDGLTGESGTLWTLPADSKKEIILTWKQKEENISGALAEDLLNGLTSPQAIPDDSLKYSDFQLNDLQENNDLHYSEGSYKLGSYKEIYGSYFEHMKAKYFLWEKNDIVYFLIVSMVDNRSVWNRKTSLEPAKELFSRFISGEVIPGIGILEKHNVRQNLLDIIK